ncbi:MAG: benzoyl-CoA reductase subunit B [Flavobacteriales bacterium]|nr:benzoyl-CoA reductase subunit B [Flavobacteriales bacterium]MCW8911857.1 benzoyl-CoA reductase subunit B [Flavobacteriales bacterium]MCW8936372.1 benzoyl-CoA reductase subunit B [Flavobacteriales bacterium]MCW8939658.1 benzoyl-CoA reductase subunit B [Flavobacteriales bacterium]MCW8969518.1 benzoyl-CoA reductase subunit B [Flavobacteriales bacterium]
MSKEAIKEKSMILQKEMVEGLFNDLANVEKTGKKVCYTFVPGNLSELIRTFDMLPVYPEINALQSAMRKKSGGYIKEAERNAHSEDVCTYVKCDVGMMMKGNIGPTGTKIPEPDVLLLSYTGCFTFMKWFETLKREYPNAEVVMIHTPYQENAEITPEMTQYMVNQLKEEVIPKMEKVSGVKFDENKLKGFLKLSAEAEDWITKIFDTTKHKPSPIDAYFAGVYYIGPINIGFRGTPEAVEYYKELYSEIQERIRLGLGPVTPEGEMKEEKYRLVVEGPPNWTSFREFWKIFYDMGAVIVASSYTKVGGVYDMGWRHDPERPLESLGEYCMNCYTNLNIPQRIDLLSKCIKDYQADGYVTNSIKSCNSFSAGQLGMMREIEDRLEVPVGFIESDLVDPRYFSYSNIKNRLESYFQMLAQRKMLEKQEA